MKNSMKKEKLKIDLSFLFQFAMDDFRNKYAGSVMGVAWAFFQPLMTILIYWFVFQIGFGSAPVDGYPFILWLIAGIAPWFFINEGIVSVTSSLLEYSYLVKKILFNIDILPLVKIASCFIVQIFLVIIAILFFGFFGYYPDIYYLQLFYYMVYMLCLLIGLGYFTAAFYVFFKDLIQIVNIVMQVVFWMTPIVWNFDIMPEVVQKVLVFNPFYYIIKGYRDAFIYKEFFWENWKMGLYYWVIAVFLLIAGKKIFTKMKVHFSDVL